MEPQLQETVCLNLHSGRLAGEYVPASCDHAVVWLHGLGSHRGGEKSLAVREACARQGWPFAAFDFRGHGASSGSLRELRASLLLEDLAAIQQFLAARGHFRLGLIGSSMGGFAAAWFAKRNPKAVLGCVLIAPAFRFLERRWNSLSEAEREEWRQTGCLRVRNAWIDVELGYGFVEDREAFAPFQLYGGWTTPAILFHGCGDDAVPFTESLDFLRTVQFPDVELRLLKDGDHRLTAYKDEIATAAVRFFTRLLVSR